MSLPHKKSLRGKRLKIPHPVRHVGVVASEADGPAPEKIISLEAIRKWCSGVVQICLQILSTACQ